MFGRKRESSSGQNTFSIPTGNRGPPTIQSKNSRQLSSGGFSSTSSARAAPAVTPTGITAPDFYSIGENASTQLPTSGAGRRRTTSMSVDMSRSRYPPSSTLLGPPTSTPGTYKRRPSLFSSGYQSPQYQGPDGSVSGSSASSSSIGTPSPVLSSGIPPTSSASFYSSNRMGMQGLSQALSEEPGGMQEDGVGSFECKTCNKIFPKEATLLAHEKTHDLERPFVCDVCSVRFARRFDMERHMRTHTKETPYSCPKCQKSFSRSDGLSRHYRQDRNCALAATGDRPSIPPNPGFGIARPTTGSPYPSSTTGSTFAIPTASRTVKKASSYATFSI